VIISGISVNLRGRLNSEYSLVQYAHTIIVVQRAGHTGVHTAATKHKETKTTEKGKNTPRQLPV